MFGVPLPPVPGLAGAPPDELAPPEPPDPELDPPLPRVDPVPPGSIVPLSPPVPVPLPTAPIAPVQAHSEARRLAVARRAERAAGGRGERRTESGISIVTFLSA